MAQDTEPYTSHGSLHKNDSMVEIPEMEKVNSGGNHISHLPKPLIISIIIGLGLAL